MTRTCIFVGPTRTGTTSLFRMLSALPEVALSTEKETNYFLKDKVEGIRASSGSYDSFFSISERTRVRVEASPLYFMFGTPVARDIIKELPDAHLVVTLRDPIARFKSLYQHSITKRNAGSGISFETFVANCWREPPSSLPIHRSDLDRMSLLESLYGDRLAEWLEFFGKDRITILFSEWLDDLNARSAIDKALAHALGLPNECLAAYDLLHENRSIGYRHAALHKIALSINHKMQPILNRQVALRNAIRAAYYSLNGRALRVSYNSRMLSEVGQLIQKDKNLHSLLDFKDNELYPAWLRGLYKNQGRNK